MWIFVNDAFLSIVQHNRRKTMMMVRARVRGDIETVFPGARVSVTPQHDYPFRAVISRKAVVSAMATEVNRIDYYNFKNSVAEDDRHDAYFKVWTAMYNYGRDRMPVTRTPL